MKDKILKFFIAICLLYPLTACASKKPESENSVDSEDAAEPEVIESDTENVETDEEPDEFSDAPEIIIPSEDDIAETMVPQENTTLEIEESEDGSF